MTTTQTDQQFERVCVFVRDGVCCWSFDVVGAEVVADRVSRVLALPRSATHQ